MPTLVPDGDPESCFAPTFTVTHEHLLRVCMTPKLCPGGHQHDCSAAWAAGSHSMHVTPCMSGPPSSHVPRPTRESLMLHRALHATVSCIRCVPEALREHGQPAVPAPQGCVRSKLRPARFGARRRPFPTPLLQPHSTHGASKSCRSFTATRPPPTAAVAGGRLTPRTRTCRIADVQRPRRVRFAG